MKNFVMAGLLILSLALAVYSQEAKVIMISDGDAKLAKRTYQEKLDADKAWDDLVARIANRYTASSNDANGITYVVRPGWENGITFSDDFKAIVPGRAKQTTRNTPIPTCGWSIPCGWTIPATTPEIF